MVSKSDPNDDPKNSEYANPSSAPWLSKNTPSILALLTVFLSFILFFTLIFLPLEENKKDILIYILGVLSAIDTQIFQFFFGSSKGSEIKNRMFQHQMSKQS